MSWGNEWPKQSQYDVGYGKPPSTSRFKPGQSGNPKGRRKGSKGLKTLIAEAMNEKVTITKSGVERRVTMIEALLATSSARSLKDSRLAISFLIFLIDNDVMKLDEAPQALIIRFVKP
jgi:hypothetical protein